MYDRSTSRKTLIRMVPLPNASATAEPHSLECSWDPLLISPARGSLSMGGGVKQSINLSMVLQDRWSKQRSAEQKSDWQTKAGVYLLDLKESRDPKDSLHVWTEGLLKWWEKHKDLGNMAVQASGCISFSHNNPPAFLSFSHCHRIREKCLVNRYQVKALFSKYL